MGVDPPFGISTCSQLTPLALVWGPLTEQEETSSFNIHRNSLLLALLLPPFLRQKISVKERSHLCHRIHRWYMRVQVIRPFGLAWSQALHFFEWVSSPTCIWRMRRSLLSVCVCVWRARVGCGIRRMWDKEDVCGGLQGETTSRKGNICRDIMNTESIGYEIWE